MGLLDLINWEKHKPIGHLPLADTPTLGSDHKAFIMSAEEAELLSLKTKTLVF